MLLSEIIRRNARRRPHQEAILGENERVTHAQLADRIDHTARCMAELGIVKKDRVLVQMANEIPYVELYFALCNLGAIMVPVNVRLIPAELDYIISHSEAKCFVADQERAAIAEKGVTDWGRIQARVVVGGSLAGWRSYENMIPANKIALPEYDSSDENSVAYIYYTSGTTGKPKGAMWTHRQVIEYIVNLQIDLPLCSDDSSLMAINLSHGPSIIPGLHHPLYVGGRVILYKGPQFRADEFAALAINENARFTVLVPTMFIRLLHMEGPFSRWYETFKYIKYVGARMNPAELRRAAELMHTRLVQGYGSTETVGGVTFLPPAGHDPCLPKLEERLSSAGKEYTNVRVEVVNEEGNPLSPGEIGQIAVQSDKVFHGYWQDPKASKEVLKDGWLMTGDLGRFDQDGNLYVVGRKSDMIISGGENVYPLEIEKVLSRFPGISECAVIGVPDREWGEIIFAYVVPLNGIALKIEEIIEFCKSQLASFKVPRRVVVCQDLPKNPLGKTQKFLLREKAQHFKIT